MMDVRNLGLPGLQLLKPRRFADTRGYFVETYNERTLLAAGITTRFVQDNQSYSRNPGTIRGLHFQLPPAAQAKLVRVVQGSVYDVAVDLRAGSPACGRWEGMRLTAEQGEQLFVPRGFAHGFCTLEPDTVVAYKVDDVLCTGERQRIDLERPHARHRLADPARPGCPFGQGP